MTNSYNNNILNCLLDISTTISNSTISIIPLDKENIKSDDKNKIDNIISKLFNILKLNSTFEKDIDIINSKYIKNNLKIIGNKLYFDIHNCIEMIVKSVMMNEFNKDENKTDETQTELNKTDETQTELNKTDETQNIKQSSISDLTQLINLLYDSEIINEINDNHYYKIDNSKNFIIKLNICLLIPNNNTVLEFINFLKSLLITFYKNRKICVPSDDTIIEKDIKKLLTLHILAIKKMNEIGTFITSEKCKSNTFYIYVDDYTKYINKGNKHTIDEYIKLYIAEISKNVILGKGNIKYENNKLIIN